MPALERSPNALRGKGRPPKDSHDKFVRKSFRIPPEVWALVLEFIPEGERSEAVVEGLRRTAIYHRMEQEHDAILAEEAAEAEALQQVAA